MAVATDFQSPTILLTPGIQQPLAPELPSLGVSPSGLGSIGCWRGKNLRWRHGRVEKAPGYSKISTQQLNGAVMKICNYGQRDGDNFNIALTAGATGRAYRYNPTTDNFTDLSGAIFTATQDEHFDCAVLNDLFVFGNKTNGLFKLDAAVTTASVLGGTPPGALFLLPFNHRLFAFNLSASQPYQCRYSAIDNAESWPAANYINFDDDFNEITAVALVGDDVVAIFKQRSIYLLRDQGGFPNFVQSKVVHNKGCLAYGCAIAIDGVLYFLGHDDAYAWTGGGQPESIGNYGDQTGRIVGNPIKNDLLTSLNRSAVNRCRVSVDDIDSEIWFSYPAEGSLNPNRSWVYNYVEHHWTPRDYPAMAMVVSRQATAFLAWDDAVGVWNDHPEAWDDSGGSGEEAQRVLFGDASGYVYAIGGYNFDGAAYESYVDTAQFTPDSDLSTTKLIDRIRVVSSHEVNNNVDVYLYYGDRIGTLTPDGPHLVSLAQGTNYQTSMMAFPRQNARVFALRFANNNLNEFFALEGFQFYWKGSGVN